MISVHRIGRIFLLAVLVSLGGAAPLRAQAKPASPKQRQSGTDSGQQSVSIGQQLAHETPEAAGEEKDETAEFKQSSSVRYIARMLHISPQSASLLSVLLNFVVVAALLVWAGRKYLPGMFSNRTAAIQKAMQEAQKASEEARRRLAEIESRLMKLDVEIGMMRNAAENESAAEEARIQAAAREEARKIVAAAEQEIAAEAKTARRQLTAHAADLAVGLAQKQIHVDAAADQVLVRSFVQELGAAPDNHGKDKN